MDIQKKLSILSAAARYDVSCSSSGSTRKNSHYGIGNAEKSGICHSFSSDGRCISLLKILLTNYCAFDCAYCVNRRSSDIERASFSPKEVADLTINFYRRNYIEGLFLSSAVFKNPDYTMELMLKAVSILRNDYKFNGYIHMKAIPGANPFLIRKAGELADRISVNMELPSNNSLKYLAPQKSIKNILTPMNYISSQININKNERALYKKSPSFVPAGQTTQLIVGASSDSDLKIISLSENLYNFYKLKRVYYSSYVPVSNSPKLINVKKAPLLREHRLYQADWLLRFYGFKANELLTKDNPYFNIGYDPKTDWALRNIEKFPVEINKVPYQMLLRIPGIGLQSAQKIYASRKFHSIDFFDIKKFGIVLKRAKYFITCNGKYYGNISFDESSIKNAMSPSFEQLSLFPDLSLVPT